MVIRNEKVFINKTVKLINFSLDIINHLDLRGEHYH